MGISESDIRTWVNKACAIIDGATLDYLTITIPSSRSARSFIEHAKIVVNDKSPISVGDEVWEHVSDVIESAANEGKSEAVIRIMLYRAKASAGSKTWRTDVAPGNNNRDEDDEYGGSNALANALVQSNKEFRLANKDLLGVVQAAAGEGWKLAGEMLKANQKLQQDNTELQIVLASQGNDDKPDAMKQLAVKAAGEFIDFTKAKALMTAAEDMQKRSNEAEIANEERKKALKEDRND